jgi:deazaflavin-dependent oxidoreductase (nitroreductase family)
MTDAASPAAWDRSRAALEAVFAASIAEERPLRRQLAEAQAFNQSLIGEFRATKGRVQGFFADLVLLLSTRGWRTRKLHTVPVDYVRCGDHCIVVASNEGSDWHPAWYRNLCHDDEVQVELGPATVSTRAIVLHGDDRTRMFGLVAAQIVCIGVYQGRTRRQLPVVALPHVAAGVECAPGERNLDDEWALRWSSEIRPARQALGAAAPEGQLPAT